MANIAASLSVPLAYLSIDTSDLFTSIEFTDMLPSANNAITILEHVDPPKAHRRKWNKIMKAMNRVVLQRKIQQSMMGKNVFKEKLSTDRRIHIVAHLRKIDQPEQRSEEWYARREEMITASDFGKALKSDAALTTFARQKAEPLIARHAAKIQGETYVRPVRRSGGNACQHGIMFEQVCDLVYRKLCHPGAVTEEFGLLSHPELTYLGASPDGICNESSPSDLIGRLVEYKAPYTRSIVQGVVPLIYLAQIQGQLEVTGLDECDYLECAFEKHTADDLQRILESDTPPAAYGIIVEYTVDSRIQYLYGPWNRVDESTAMELLENHNDIPDDAKIHYWTLGIYQLITIRRNKRWWDELLGPALDKVWKLVILFSNNDI